jgi:hypothetical protein
VLTLPIAPASAAEVLPAANATVPRLLIWGLCTAVHCAKAPDEAEHATAAAKPAPAKIRPPDFTMKNPIS